MQELLYHTQRYRVSNDVLHCPEPTVGLLAAVQLRVQELADQVVLDKLNQRFHTEFAYCFPIHIPHTDTLPTDVYHEILLHMPDIFSNPI